MFPEITETSWITSDPRRHHVNQGVPSAKSAKIQAQIEISNSIQKDGQDAKLRTLKLEPGIGICFTVSAFTSYLKGVEQHHVPRKCPRECEELHRVAEAQHRRGHLVRPGGGLQFLSLNSTAVRMDSLSTKGLVFSGLSMKVEWFWFMWPKKDGQMSSIRIRR